LSPWDLFSAIAVALICYLTGFVITSVLGLDTDIGLVNYAYGTAIGEFAVEGFYFPLLGKPLSNFQHIGDGTEVHTNMVDKYSNVLCILHSLRLIGWSHQAHTFDLCC